MPALINELLQRNGPQTWLTAVLVAGFVYVLLAIVGMWLLGRMRRLAQRTKNVVDDLIVGVLAATKQLFLILLAVYSGALLLDLPEPIPNLARLLILLAMTVQAALWLNRGITLWIERYAESRGGEDPGALTTVHALSFVLRIGVWTVALLLALDNLGYNVTALITGLGIGGIAVALAVQNILSDLFASLSIVLDKPFVIGDFVIVGDLAGTIETIGLKTTRIRSLSGEQLVFSNSDLLGSRIRNYKRMAERRAVFQFGVVYQTPTEVLAEIPRIVREIIEKHQLARFDRAHFTQFGPSSYDFEVVYYVLQPEFNVYRDLQQEINLELCRRFESRGIEFAYPTTTVFLANPQAEAS